MCFIREGVLAVPYVAMPYMDKVKANGLEGRFPIPMAAAEDDSIIHCIAWKGGVWTAACQERPERKGTEEHCLVTHITACHSTDNTAVLRISPSRINSGTNLPSNIYPGPCRRSQGRIRPTTLMCQDSESRARSCQYLTPCICLFSLGACSTEVAVPELRFLV